MPVSGDPVVIAGMALEAPGGIDTPDAYWAMLAEEREVLGPFPTDRGWAVRDLLDGSRREGFKRIHDRGGFLAGAAQFDPEFFGISPREAVAIDPQQRVALRVAWRALENAGINPDTLAGREVGCYVGASYLGYGGDLAEFTAYSGHLLTGTTLGAISGRIAYVLGLGGPALTIDASCTGGLAALHVAVSAVRAGDCDVALTGGVCVLGSPGYFVEFSSQHALSDDGHCRPYSAHASGTVWAEGAAMFVLQRRSAALRNGRSILAEVRATAGVRGAARPGVPADGRDAQRQPELASSGGQRRQLYDLDGLGRCGDEQVLDEPAALLVVRPHEHGEHLLLERLPRLLQAVLRARDGVDRRTAAEPHARAGALREQARQAGVGQVLVRRRPDLPVGGGDRHPDARVVPHRCPLAGA